MTKTYSAKPGEVGGAWWVVDADGKTLGKLAVRVANVLRGKDKPQFTVHEDVGDFVVVVNAEKIHMTGRKWEQKKYHDHSGYLGGIHTYSATFVRDKHPDRIIRDAVKGMLPGNKLGKKVLTKLKIYAGPNHPHSAQQPKTLEV